MSCEFCKGEASIEVRHDYYGVEYDSVAETLDVECTRSGWECGGRIISIEIKYCPMCGQKLEAKQ